MSALSAGRMSFDPPLTSDPGGAIALRQLEPGEEAAWDRFVLASPMGTFFHLSGWQRLVERILGHRSIPLTAFRENRISGIFPVSRIRSRVFGDCLVSLPLAVYGGICSCDRESYSA